MVMPASLSSASPESGALTELSKCPHPSVHPSIHPGANFKAAGRGFGFWEQWEREREMSERRGARAPKYLPTVYY